MVEAHIDHRDLVAALGAVADGRANQLLDPVHFVVGAGGVVQLALGAQGGHAIDRNSHRQALDLTGLLHLGAGGVRDLVVGGLFLVSAVGAVSGFAARPPPNCRGYWPP